MSAELVPRTVLLTAEDWAWWETKYTENTTYRHHRLCNAIRDSRPREPRTVELDGETLTENEDGCWETEAGGWENSRGRAAKALVKIWTLEHPDEADR